MVARARTYHQLSCAWGDWVLLSAPDSRWEEEQRRIVKHSERVTGDFPPTATGHPPKRARRKRRPGVEMQTRRMTKSQYTTRKVGREGDGQGDYITTCNSRDGQRSRPRGQRSASSPLSSLRVKGAKGMSLAGTKRKAWTGHQRPPPCNARRARPALWTTTLRRDWLGWEAWSLPARGRTIKGRRHECRGSNEAKAEDKTRLSTTVDVELSHKYGVMSSHKGAELPILLEVTHRRTPLSASGNSPDSVWRRKVPGARH